MGQTLRRQTGIGKLFSAGVQALGVQLLGALFFYLLSLHLSKSSFGLVSWANAVAMTITTVLSFGMEQVVLRRIAAGNRSSDWTAVAYFLHALVASVCTAGILGAASFFFKSSWHGMQILPGFFLVQALAFLVTPMRQLLNAREQFTPYAVIALLSNAAKILLALLWIRHGPLTIPVIVRLLLICTGAELAATLLYVRWKVPLQIRLRWTAYRKLLKESLPQFMAVLFDISLARADWILLGILSTDLAIADYSFAYRAFEIARMPVTIIGMVLLPRLARLLQRGDRLEASQEANILRFFRLELFAGVGIALLLNLLWVPVVSTLTHGTYGTSNAVTMMILSACIPVHFAINLLWTLCFASRQYRAAARTTIISSLVNVGLNLILIPIYGGLGAAIAFLIASLVQLLLYLRVVRGLLQIRLWSLLLLSATAGAILYLYAFWPFPAAVGIPVALLSYLGVAVLLRQFQWQDGPVILQWLRK